MGWLWSERGVFVFVAYTHCACALGWAGRLFCFCFLLLKTEERKCVGYLCWGLDGLGICVLHGVVESGKTGGFDNVACLLLLCFACWASHSTHSAEKGRSKIVSLLPHVHRYSHTNTHTQNLYKITQTTQIKPTCEPVVRVIMCFALACLFLNFLYNWLVNFEDSWRDSSFLPFDATEFEYSDRTTEIKSKTDELRSFPISHILKIVFSAYQLSSP